MKLIPLYLLLLSYSAVLFADVDYSATLSAGRISNTRTTSDGTHKDFSFCFAPSGKISLFSLITIKDDFYLSPSLHSGYLRHNSLDVTLHPYEFPFGTPFIGATLDSRWSESQYSDVTNSQTRHTPYGKIGNTIQFPGETGISISPWIGAGMDYLSITETSKDNSDDDFSEKSNSKLFLGGVTLLFYYGEYFSVELDYTLAYDYSNKHPYNNAGAAISAHILKHCSVTYTFAYIENSTHEEFKNLIGITYSSF